MKNKNQGRKGKRSGRVEGIMQKVLDCEANRNLFKLIRIDPKIRLGPLKNQVTMKSHNNQPHAIKLDQN